MLKGDRNSPITMIFQRTVGQSQDQVVVTILRAVLSGVPSSSEGVPSPVPLAPSFLSPRVLIRPQTVRSSPPAPSSSQNDNETIKNLKKQFSGLSFIWGDAVHDSVEESMKEWRADMIFGPSLLCCFLLLIRFPRPQEGYLLHCRSPTGEVMSGGACGRKEGGEWRGRDSRSKRKVMSVDTSCVSSVVGRSFNHLFPSITPQVPIFRSYDNMTPTYARLADPKGLARDGLTPLPGTPRSFQTYNFQPAAVDSYRMSMMVRSVVLSDL